MMPTMPTTTPPRRLPLACAALARARCALVLLAVAVGLVGNTACVYKAGSGLMAGVLDESAGKGRSGGVEPIVDGLVERALLAELGHQLGEGLRNGAADVTPEQRARLEDTIDGLVTVATMRAANGLRRDVSPELRALVQRDIVEAFADGVRGDLGPTLEQTVDRLVTRAIVSLRRNLDEDETRFVTSDLLRDSIYLAMREGNFNPSIGDTLRTTVEQDVLDPFSNNVTDLAHLIAGEVDAQAQRGERTLRAVIGALILIIGVFLVYNVITRRQLRRERLSKVRSELDRRSLDAALAQLDDASRQAVEAKLGEIRTIVETIEDKEP